MLKVAFDIVEVLRFLKAKRNILHRDISAGNVMYAPPSEDPDTSTQDDEVLFFSDFFLSDSPRRPQTTSVLLVVFNHAKHLVSKTDGLHEGVERTGTAMFMARTVELGRPVDIPRRPLDRFLGPISSAPDRYAKHYHNTRLKKSPPKPLEDFTEAAKSAAWGHELDHDIESVFCLMLYWAITAQPKGAATEHIAAMAWFGLTGEFSERQFLLLSGFLRGLIVEGTFHSTFRPLEDLFLQLAEILASMDRHWLHASEMRNDPEYFAEAFQRLILQFLIKYNDDDDNSFMNQTIESNPRKLEQQSM